MKGGLVLSCYTIKLLPPLGKLLLPFWGCYITIKLSRFLILGILLPMHLKCVPLYLGKQNGISGHLDR